MSGLYLFLPTLLVIFISFLAVRAVPLTHSPVKSRMQLERSRVAQSSIWGCKWRRQVYMKS